MKKTNKQTINEEPKLKQEQQVHSEQKEEKTKQEKNNYVSYNGKLKIENNQLVNQYSEPIQLRGISTHGIQWYGDFANESVIKTLKEEWNINLFRIAMYTSEGGYLTNKNLKQKVEEIVDIATNLDLYVIIDWHILTDNNPMTNIEEAKTFFKEISEEYKDNKNIIYEICNEPNGGTNWDNDIRPYAEEITKIIRKNTDNIIIVGTPTWSQDVLDAAQNPIEEKNIMYSLHFYSGTHKEELRIKASEALKTIPIFVSELGVSDASGNNGVYLEEAKKWLEFINNNNLSWAVWSLSDKDESSALLKPGTNKTNITDNDLTEAGIFIKQQLRNDK